MAKQFGIPEWRAKKYKSGLIDEGTGDIDIWQGTGLTKNQKASIMKDVFSGIDKADSGYSVKRYPNKESFFGETSPGALAFKANGEVERWPSPWQRYDPTR